MSEQNDYLDVARSQRLQELGAFEGREWKVGDWVYRDTCKFVLIDCDIHLPDPNAPKMVETHVGDLVRVSECLLLPSLHDLMTRLTQVCKESDNFRAHWAIYYDQAGFSLYIDTVGSQGSSLKDMGFVQIVGAATEMDVVADALIKLLENLQNRKKK